MYGFYHNDQELLTSCWHLSVPALRPLHREAKAARACYNTHVWLSCTDLLNCGTPGSELAIPDVAARGVHDVHGGDATIAKQARARAPLPVKTRSLGTRFPSLKLLPRML